MISSSFSRKWATWSTNAGLHHAWAHLKSSEKGSGFIKNSISSFCLYSRLVLLYFQGWRTVISQKKKTLKNFRFFLIFTFLTFLTFMSYFFLLFLLFSYHIVKWISQISRFSWPLNLNVIVHLVVRKVRKKVNFLVRKSKKK